MRGREPFAIRLLPRKSILQQADRIMAKRYRTAEVYGMCGGVFAALKMVEKAVAECGNEPLYVLHEWLQPDWRRAGWYLPKAFQISRRAQKC